MSDTACLKCGAKRSEHSDAVIQDMCPRGISTSHDWDDTAYDEPGIRCAPVASPTLANLAHCFGRLPHDRPL